MTLPPIVLVRLRLAVAVLVALVALVAGPAAFGAAPGAAATSTRSGTSRSAAGVAIDRRIARKAGLQRSDFPAGWTSSPAPAQTMRSACPGVNAAEASVSARERSREFMLDDSATAQSAVYMYPDTATSVRSYWPGITEHLKRNGTWKKLSRAESDRTSSGAPASPTFQ